MAFEGTETSISLTDRFAAMRSHVDALAQVAPRDLDGSGALELFDAVYELSDRLEAIAVRALPVVETDGLWVLGGARTFAAWLARRARVTHARAKRMTRLGRALRDELPATAAAVVAGGPDRVGVEHAEILTSVAATSPARRDALVDPHLPCNERFLVDQARMLSADQLRTLARRWAAAADPDADERGYRDATEREFFDVSPTTGGCHLSGFLTTEHGQVLLIALDAISGVPAKDDERTGSQRRAGALGDLARLTLDHGLAGSCAAVRPHLNVHVDYPTLHALASAAGVADHLPGANPTSLSDPTTAHPAVLDPAVLDPATFDPLRFDPALFEDGQPVPRLVLERILCDCEISRTVFGPDSQIINVGRSKRYFTGQLRRAVIARDKHCQYPACDAPPRLCEGHHTRHWERDHGPTDARAGILLCWHHHAHVHTNGIQITWKPTGGWQFTNRHGETLQRE